ALNLRQDSSPRIDDDRMAEGLAAILMKAALSGRYDESPVFRGACTLENVPMRLARLPGEGGRRCQDFCAGKRLGPEKLRKAHFVADGETDARDADVRDDRLAAGLVGR